MLDNTVSGTGTVKHFGGFDPEYIAAQKELDAIVKRLKEHK